MVFIAPAAKAADDVAAFNKAWSAYEILSSQGFYDEAVIPAKEALRLAELLEPDNKELHATLTYAVAMAYLRAHDSEEAETWLERTLSRSIDAYGAQSEDVASVHGALATLYRQNDRKRSRNHYQAAVDILEALHGEDHPSTSPYLRGLGAVFLSEFNVTAANRRFMKAVRITETAGPAYAREYGLALFELAKLDMVKERERRAIKGFKNALNVLEAMPQPDQGAILIVHSFLIEAYERRGESEEATKHVHYLASMQPESETKEPEPLFRIKPEWPRRALEVGRGGQAVIAFTIDAEGRVKDERILESEPGKMFDEYGLEAVRQFRFKPRIRDGEFVETPDQTIRLIWEIAY